jgi:hypothetical protein
MSSKNKELMIGVAAAVAVTAVIGLTWYFSASPPKSDTITLLQDDLSR